MMSWVWRWVDLDLFATHLSTTVILQYWNIKGDAHWWVYYILTIYVHQACHLHWNCIALHCNDSYFHSKWPFFQIWPNWLKKVNLLSFQSKWSGLKKMVILSENSCHCNAMQCNFNEGDKLDAHRPLPIIAQRSEEHFWFI